MTLDELLRWEAAGGTWRVLRLDSTSASISLRRCDGGEEADRVVSTDPALVAHVTGRRSSEDD
ncbi:hypothetical protein [Gordonia soli]|uniref:hypothetical protein n=1 Tax=Gordonia soli TaxID=320799 RepID=UPI00034B1E1E|nr:hypothetical protein [Gordonia soli]